jgi:hypothetical protein
VRRVLKTGGQFLFIEHGKSPNAVIAWLQKILTPLSQRISGGCRLDREPDALLCAAGFALPELQKESQGLHILSYTYKGCAVISS